MQLLQSDINIFLAFTVSTALAAVIIPVIKKLSARLGLLDKPNARKVHTNSIPVIGGMSIGLTLLLSLMVSPSFMEILSNYYIIIATSLVLMLVGILDDKLNLKATHRLAIQLICAYALAASGIRLTSLYGILGIGELGALTSYLLSIFLITGVVNAFNLIDGIDGLAGFLAFIGLSIFAYTAYALGDMPLVLILTTLIGGVFVFLTQNLRKKKIFLGDGGSLLLGFILVAVGIKLIESSALSPILDVSNTISIVFGVFLIPVLDSLRVYISRMNEGFSPFRADNRHIHHLFLSFDISHKKASSTIAFAAIGFISLLVLIYTYYGLSSAIAIVSGIFLSTTSLLAAIQQLNTWKKTISELENRD
jgi:UDP-GlcNAc:undecaprenyl-phosphate GlcNAc-1-phosphate transferase